MAEPKIWECAWKGLRGMEGMTLFRCDELLFLTLNTDTAKATYKVAVCLNTGECFNEDFFTDKVIKQLNTNIKEVIFTPSEKTAKFGEYQAGKIFLFNGVPHLKLVLGLSLADRLSNSAEALNLKDGTPCFVETFCHEFIRLNEKILPVEIDYNSLR